MICRCYNSCMNESKPYALITGASAGLGACFAKALATRGLNLILVARRKERLEKLATSLEENHKISAEVFPADLTNATDLAKVYDRIKQCENLEFLINNAGFGTHPLFAESDLESQSAMLKLHVNAVAELSHAALPNMVKCNKGNIINVCSVAGFFSSPTNVLYCSTKAWGIAFSKSLAIELADTNVNVEALCPGFTYTEFHDVMQINRKLVPKPLWLNANYVVEKSLKALGKKTVCIPSLRYKMFVLLSRITPEFIKNYLAKKRIKKLHKAF